MPEVRASIGCWDVILFFSRRWIGKPFFDEPRVPSNRLIPFRGLKEDIISFAFLDTEKTEPLSFAAEGDPVQGPFASTCNNQSLLPGFIGVSLDDLILADLAGREDTLVILSPRYPEQAQKALDLDWVRQPWILDNKADFVALLKGVDVVVSSSAAPCQGKPHFSERMPAASTWAPKGAVRDFATTKRFLGLLSYSLDIEQFRNCPFSHKQESGKLEPRKEVVGKIVEKVEDIVSR